MSLNVGSATGSSDSGTVAPTLKRTRAAIQIDSGFAAMLNNIRCQSTPVLASRAHTSATSRKTRIVPAAGPNSSVPQKTNVSETEMFAETFGSFTGRNPLSRVSIASQPKSLDGRSRRREDALKATTEKPTNMTAAS